MLGKKVLRNYAQTNKKPAEQGWELWSTVVCWIHSWRILVLSHWIESHTATEAILQPPDQLNLQEGLVSQIKSLNMINREDVQNGNDAAEHACQQENKANRSSHKHKSTHTKEWLQDFILLFETLPCLGPPLFEHMLEIEEQNNEQKLNQRFLNFHRRQLPQAIRETEKEAGSYNVAS